MLNSLAPSRLCTLRRQRLCKLIGSCVEHAQQAVRPACKRSPNRGRNSKHGEREVLRVRAESAARPGGRTPMPRRQRCFTGTAAHHDTKKCEGCPAGKNQNESHLQAALCRWPPIEHTAANEIRKCPCPRSSGSSNVRIPGCLDPPSSGSSVVRLTLPSNGHTTAGHNVSLRQGWCRRCVPLMSNVRRRKAQHVPTMSRS